MIPNERLSDLIGAIYDCAIDPERWPQSMAAICQEIDCLFSAIVLVDLDRSHLKFFKDWNNDPVWRARLPKYYAELASFYRAAPGVLAGPIDEPLVLSRDLPAELWLQSRVYREWGKPRGISDMLQTVVLREARRVGGFFANRHISKGVAKDRDIEILRLLAPHIRRAVTISDLLDLKSLERQAFAATLDHLAAGVIVVGPENRILHANEAARRMFQIGQPVRSANGRLAVRDALAHDQLTKAIAAARESDWEIGATGIGVALAGAPGEPALAHVLPLARGDLRTRLMPQALAAVFVTQPSTAPLIDVEAIAASIGLTQAETRLLALLIGGVTLSDAAVALDIGYATAKTHLGHIFSKAEVSRQTDLIALVYRFAAGIQGLPPAR